MEFLHLLANTVLLRPYVFVFLGVSLFAARNLFGWPRTLRFFGITWAVGFFCEFSSTRIGVPFGPYYYTGSTMEEELYISNIPFMDSISFSFLLFSSYCLALVFALPEVWTSSKPGWSFNAKSGVSWPVLVLTVIFFTFSDIVIDPVALQGDRWFLGEIYGYPHVGIYFGVPIANFLGWAVVGSLSMLIFRGLEQSRYRNHPVPRTVVGKEILLGVGLYYGVLAFSLGVTFWIGEVFLGLVGILIFTPVKAIFLIRLWKMYSTGERA